MTCICNANTIKKNSYPSHEIRLFLLVAFISQSLLPNQTNASQSPGTFTSTKQIITPEYESKNLIINKLSDHVYRHISYLNTESFGRVVCNGMIVVNGNEAVVFDTPATNETAKELIGYLTGKLHAKIKGIVATNSPSWAEFSSPFG